MTTVELESLMVRLLGDGSDYQKMLKDAVTSTQDAAKQAQDATSKIEGMKASIQGFGSGVKEFAAQAAGALAAVGISAGLMSSFFKFEQAQLGVDRLSYSIKQNGGEVQSVTSDYMKFASEVASTTTSSKGATLGMLQHAEMLGLSGEKAKAAVKDAIALSAAVGGEADSYLRATIALEKGNPMLVARTLGLRGEMDAADSASKQAELLAEVQKRVGDAYGLALIQGRTVSAQLERAGRVTQGFAKDVGQALAPAISTAVDWLTKAVKWFNELDPVVRKTIVTATAMVAVLTALVSAAPAVGAVLVSMAGSFKALTASLGTASVNAWVAAIGAATTIGVGLTTLVYNSSPIVQKFNDIIAEGAVLAMQKLKDYQAETTKTVEELGLLPQASKQAFAATEITAAEQAIKGYRSAIKSAKANIELNKGLVDNKDVEVDQANIKTYLALIDSANDRVRALREGMKDPLQSKKFAKEIEDARQAIELHIATLGMAAEQVEIYKFKQKGATDEQLEGFTRSVKVLLMMKDAQEQAKKAAEAHNKVMEEGRHVMDQFRNPTEKFNDRMADLDNLLAEGAIDMMTFVRATNAAQEELDGAAEKAKDFREEVQKMDAVAAGSTEAAARIAAYQERLAAPEKAKEVRNLGVDLRNQLTPQQKDAAEVDRRAREAQKAMEERQAPFNEAARKEFDRQMREGNPLPGPVGPPAPGPGERNGVDWGVLKEIRDAIVRGEKKPVVEVEVADLDDIA